MRIDKTESNKHKRVRSDPNALTAEEIRHLRVKEYSPRSDCFTCVNTFDE